MEHWYVIQVQSGLEDHVAFLCRALLPRLLYRECFPMRYERMRRYEGAWHKEQGILFPGYLFIITDEIDRIWKALQAVPRLTRILGENFEFVPLMEDEVYQLEQCGGQQHVVGMSEGYMVGMRTVVTSGPMKNMKGEIRRIDRHRRLAWVEMELFGRTLEVQMGLEIIRRE